MENTKNINNQEYVEMEDCCVEAQEVQEEPKEKFGAKLRRIAKKVGKVAIVVAAGFVGYTLGKRSEPEANDALILDNSNGTYVLPESTSDQEYADLVELENSNV